MIQWSMLIAFWNYVYLFFSSLIAKVTSFILLRYPRDYCILKTNFYLLSLKAQVNALFALVIERIPPQHHVVMYFVGNDFNLEELLKLDLFSHLSVEVGFACLLCRNCIMEWCNEKPECPLCRTPLTHSSLVCLYHSDFWSAIVMPQRFCIFWNKKEGEKTRSAAFFL